MVAIFYALRATTVRPKESSYNITVSLPINCIGKYLTISSFIQLDKI
jgi:hypothetical protein